MFNALTFLIEGSGSLGRAQRLASRIKDKADKAFREGRDDEADEQYAKLHNILRHRNALSAKWDVSRKPKEKRTNLKLDTGSNPIHAKVDVTGFKPKFGIGSRVGFWEMAHKKETKDPKPPRGTPNVGRGTFSTKGGKLQTRVANLNPKYHGQRLYPRLLRALEGKYNPDEMAPDTMLSTGARRAWKRATGNSYSSLGKLTKKGNRTRRAVIPTRTAPKKINYKV